MKLYAVSLPTCNDFYFSNTLIGRERGECIVGVYFGRDPFKKTFPVRRYLTEIVLILIFSFVVIMLYIMGKTLTFLHAFVIFVTLRSLKCINYFCDSLPAVLAAVSCSRFEPRLSFQSKKLSLLQLLSEASWVKCQYGLPTTTFRPMWPRVITTSA